MYNTNSNKKKILIIIGAIIAIWVLSKLLFVGRQRSIAGIPDPVQVATKGGNSLKKSGYDITISYLYEYEIEALVVSTKRYYGSSFADKLSPMDVALAWGSAAEYNTACKIKWSQRGRWYYWRCNESSAFDEAGGSYGISTHSSNNHLIPCDSVVKNQIKRIKVGDHIKIKGYLVNVDATKGNNTYWWYSSTSREDEGDGACEVIYVTEVEWL